MDGRFYVGRHELGDVAAVAGSLLDDGGGKVAPLDAGGEEHGLDAGHQCVVGLRQLDLVFEIRHGPQAPHHHRGVALLGELHGQAVKALHRHVRDVLAALLQQRHPLLYGEQGVLRAVDEHCHDEVVVDLCCPLDDVEMSSRDRVEGPGVNCCCHRYGLLYRRALEKRNLVLP